MNSPNRQKSTNDTDRDGITASSTCTDSDGSFVTKSARLRKNTGFAVFRPKEVATARCVNSRFTPGTEAEPAANPERQPKSWKRVALREQSWVTTLTAGDAVSRRRTHGSRCGPAEIGVRSRNFRRAADLGQRIAVPAPRKRRIPRSARGQPRDLSVQLRRNRTVAASLVTHGALALDQRVLHVARRQQ